MSDNLTPRDILGPDGRIAARLDNYEHRQPQLDMADAVANAMQRQRHLIVEAGTGVGKSFAYLVPAILAATQETKTKRIIISTHTISLQEQLLSKDIPFLNSVIPREFTAVLVKGRRNYLSLRRMDLARVRAGSLFHEQDDVDELIQLHRWSKDSPDGSLSDLDYRPQCAVWDEVASDSANCMGRKCPTYQKCFYYRARQRASHAQLLIVNHALFFSDLALRNVGASILPDYDAVILDEAHTLPDVAGSHLGLSVSSGQVDYVLNKLYNDRTNKGLLVHYNLQKAEQSVDRCRILASQFFNDLQHWHDNQSGNGRVSKDHIVEDVVTEPLKELSAVVKDARRHTDDEAQEQDFLAASNRLNGLADEVRAWLAQEEEQDVHWLEVAKSRRRSTRVVLKAAPIDLGPVLRERLFNVVPSVVMTSATLAIGAEGNFDFFKSRIGLTQSETKQLGSPFDYQQQARIILPRGLPDPSSARADDARMIVPCIQKYVEQTDGHAFVLFTSYQMLRNVASQLSVWLRSKNLGMLSQADGMPRQRMLEQFKKNPRAVLLGTDSFWQGVDVPGDALQNVIITKLPFSVPDQPLLAAQLESIRAAGGNPFRDFQLPEAVIKLRQGFGRLIRSQQDRGIVVILDPRIRTKFYGRLFLDSLPSCEIVEDAVPLG